VAKAQASGELFSDIAFQEEPTTHKYCLFFIFVTPLPPPKTPPSILDIIIVGNP